MYRNYTSNFILQADLSIAGCFIYFQRTIGIPILNFEIANIIVDVAAFKGNFFTNFQRF